MKKIILCLTLLLMSYSLCYAEILYDDLNYAKEPAYRVGTTDDIENKLEVKAKSELETVEADERYSKNISDLTYADLSIKYMSKEIASIVDDEYDAVLNDLSFLWQGAATKSDTVKYAIYKLSNPDEDKPSNQSLKKVLSTIASMSTLVGAGTGNPMIASLSMIGGNAFSIFSQDAKALNYKYTRVNDADMIILVRKIDELQQKVVDAYYDYVTSRLFLDKTTEMVKIRYENYNSSQNSSKEVILVLDAYYRDAVDNQMKAKNN